MNLDRITGLLLIEVRNSNPNGDPDRESDPRQRADGRGEISPVSVKRKIRDLIDNKDGPVWRETGAKLDPGHFHILETRGRRRDEIEDEIVKDGAKQFVEKYWDGRVFGNTFLEKRSDIEKRHPKASKQEIDKIGRAMSGNIRTGVAQFGLGVSIAPVRIERKTMSSKAGVEEGTDRGLAPLAYRIVEHGLYEMPFFVNPSTADRSGCKGGDIELLLKVLPHIFSHTSSLARTQVYLRHIYILTHASPLGSVSDFRLLDALRPKRKGDANLPSTGVEALSQEYEIPDLASAMKPFRDKLKEDARDIAI